MGLGGGGQVAWPFRLASRQPPLVPAVTSVTLLTVKPHTLGRCTGRESWAQRGGDWTLGHFAI